MVSVGIGEPTWGPGQPFSDGGTSLGLAVGLILILFLPVCAEPAVSSLVQFIRTARCNRDTAVMGEGSACWAQARLPELKSIELTSRLSRVIDGARLDIINKDRIAGVATRLSPAPRSDVSFILIFR